jgi:hypothetical protein
MPDGFKKVKEKYLVEIYTVPDYLPVKESMKVVLDVLDQILYEKFEFHFLEPVIEVKEYFKAKPIIEKDYTDRK